MREENKHLSSDQARHLTTHGVNQNEDGSYSWKFDNYVRSWPPYDFSARALEQLWGRKPCPTLLVVGTESWASNPATDGRIVPFRNAEVAAIEGAGHWIHHDQLEVVLERVTDFIE